MNKKYDLVLLISCYLRSDTLNVLLLSLEDKEFDHIFFVVDGPKNDKDVILNNAVLSLIDDFSRNMDVTVLHSTYNLGPFENLKRGLEEVFLLYESVVYLEDDVIASEDFFNFMELAKYSLISTNNIKAACGFLPIPVLLENRVFLSKSLSTSAHMISRESYLEIINLYNCLNHIALNDFLVKINAEGYLQSGNIKWLEFGIKILYKNIFFNYELLVLIILSKVRNYSLFPNKNVVSIESFTRVNDVNFNSPNTLLLLPKKIRNMYLRKIEKYEIETNDFGSAIYYPVFDNEWSKIKGEGYSFEKFILRLESLLLLLKYKEFKAILKIIKRLINDT